MAEETPRECRIVISHMMLPQDANPSGNVHGGVIMKLIDSAAGVVAIRHARSNVVTASIDRLDFHHPVYVGNLVTLEAQLNWVGKSSMEIGVRAESEDLVSGLIRHVATAYLTFVALDENGRPQKIPPLPLLTEDDQRRFRMAAARREDRLQQKKREAECDLSPDRCRI
jgi:uncharacterized protein (TIGR00369 family)